MKNIFTPSIDLDVRLFIQFLEEDYPIKITKSGDIYNVYTLDSKLIFLTSNAKNVVDGLKLLYGKE